MITEWVPAASSNSAVDPQLLSRMAELTETLKTDASAVREALGEKTLNDVQSWLKLPETAWQPVIEGLAEKELFPLAIFFTLGEVKFSGWQCGSSNPAIWLFRYMKGKGLLPPKDQIRELKSWTDNRFIPYGSVL